MVNNKDFDGWNIIKKSVEIQDRDVFGYPREVWWCSIGINIGAEADGKNENFERPVIILRVYNKETMLVLPTTGREKTDKFHLNASMPRIAAGHLGGRSPNTVIITRQKCMSNQKYRPPSIADRSRG